tara:strand:+ start:1552 stop:2073 length:522 start_codon:yes stop_codon:yes gene_type:complete
MKHISVESFKEVVQVEANNTSVDFINVCTPAEYKEKHIHGVRSVPLDEIDSHIDEFQGKKTIYVHCLSGKRGARAVQQLQALGVTAELVNVEGGLMAWDAAGLPTNSMTKRLPLLRQVFIAAGLLLLLGYMLSVSVHESFIYLTVAVSAGLIFAGVTGWCGISYMLAKLPWNR